METADLSHNGYEAHMQRTLLAAFAEVALLWNAYGINFAYANDHETRRVTFQLANELLDAQLTS